MSLFKKRKSSRKLKPPLQEQSSFPSSLSPTSASRRGTSPSPLPSASPSSFDLASLHVDDFGRPIDQPLPAFASAGGGAPFGTGYGVGDDEGLPPAEMQLLYGYAPLSTTLELSVLQVEDIMRECAEQIRRRGLDTPLIMSSMALDISLEGVCSLIRSYLDEPQGWAADLHLAAPLSIGAFLKWALGRLVSERGTRGFVSWESYSDFKLAERATGYQPRSCTVHLISRLSAANGRLLTTLLSFFSSISAHSASNGMPPRKLAALFSPYIFGLPDDRTFDETYQEWQRGTDAFEHILLSYLRDQQAEGPLPTFLERFIVGYPATLNISYTNSPPTIPKGARVEEVMRVKRLTRFHSRNLVQQSATWEVPHSNHWKLFFDPTDPSSKPAYTASYRHLLNIRSNHGLEDGGGYDDEGEMQKFKSGIEKEWAKFGDLGFSDVDSKKLEFDLTEGERAQMKKKRDTLDWSTFETAGFSGREIFAPTDLVFHHTLSQRVNTWPSSQKALADKLRATEQLLPAFPYDTTPHEEGRVLIERDFVEAWADVLVSGGWARDELKESSFALVGWKARPREGEYPRGKSSGSDPRSEERYVLVEEYVPREYREALLRQPEIKKQSKRISFMRAVRRRSTQKGIAPPASPSSRPSTTSSTSFSTLVPAPLSSSYARKDSGLRPIDENVFNPGAPYETQHLTLSNLHVGGTSNSYAPSTVYAPSIVSTVRAADGHGPADSTAHLSSTAVAPPVPPMPSIPPSPRGAGVGGAMSSQTRESAFGGQGLPAGLGYTKPEPTRRTKGFLARIGTMRTGRSNSNSPAATTAPEVLAAPYTQASPPPPVQQQQAYSPASPPRPREHVSNVPLSPSRDHVSDGVAAPAVNGAYANGVHANGVIPGAPPLAPVVGSPRSAEQEQSPPLPPKEQHLNGSRSTVDSIVRDTVSDDPYGGMDDSEVDESGAQVGQVLFRGSQSYPRQLNVQGGQDGLQQYMAADDQPVETSERVANPVAAGPPLVGALHPPRTHSLRDSEKPYAEVPIDENDPRFPHQDRYLSGVSQFSSRVANIVGLYEDRDRTREILQQRPPDVRLTQYGFTEEAKPPPALP
ncbi:hypothetical protein JCM11251_002224 [Rhodosporidiobolus azoricus]